MKNKPGFVYLFEDIGNGLFKLGQTRQLRKRIYKHSIGVGTGRLIWFIATNDAVRLERFLKARWRSWRVRGEWFRLPSEFVAEFRGLSIVNYVGIPPTTRPPAGEIYDWPRSGRNSSLRVQVRVGEVIQHPKRKRIVPM